MGEFPAEEYKMQHDIYSLGVCLLEIGLWEPLVEYPEDGGQTTAEYGRVCRDFAGMGGRGFSSRSTWSGWPRRSCRRGWGIGMPRLW
jgi:hypothetical protein